MDSGYSRSGVYYSAVNKILSNQIYLRVPSKLRRQIFFFKQIAKKYDNNTYTILIMSPSHKLTIIAKIFTSFDIILDAGWSLTESSLSRKLVGMKKLAVIKNYIIDFIAMNIANIVVLESKSQIDYCKNLFKLPNNKCEQLFTGFNEVTFEKNQSSKNVIKIPELINVKNSSSIVFFRGKYNSESGLENILEAARLLENQKIHFIIATDVMKKNHIPPHNVTYISRFLSDGEIIYLYNIATICLGQMSQIARLRRTIPHKAFEAAFFSKPYVTYDSVGIREFLPNDNQAFYINNLEPVNIANKILELIFNEDLIVNLSINIHERYMAVAHQDKLGRALLGILNRK